jgi:hypothetical protein
MRPGASRNSSELAMCSTRRVLTLSLSWIVPVQEIVEAKTALAAKGFKPPKAPKE